MKLIIDEVQYVLNCADCSYNKLILYLSCACVVALLISFFQSLSNYFNEKQSVTVTNHVYKILHTKSVNVDLSYYEDSKNFDTLHRAQKEGTYRPGKIVNGLIQLSRNFITLIAMSGLLFFLHWSMGILLMVSAVPGLLLRLKHSNKIYKWQRQKTKVERKAFYYNMMLTSSSHAKEIRLFKFGDLFINRFNSLRNNLKDELLVISRKRLFLDFSAQAFSTIIVFICFGFIVYRAITGNISVGDMVMYFQAFRSGLTQLKGFLGGVAGIYEDNLFISNLYEFLDIKNSLKDPDTPVDVPVPIEKGIAFENVHFHYPTSQKHILKNITFSIKPGEIVALVGENGAGKTTLIKLLCRLYDPGQGKITIDGIDIRQLKIDDLRRQISVLFQDYMKYHLSTKENIWLGDINSPKDNIRLQQAANKAGLGKVIDQWPEKFDTVLGKLFENGEELSMGQWQKIALARSFFRDSPIIIMDEPTSSLDPVSEFLIFNRFKELLEDKITILISHRLSTVRLADRIIMLEDGQVVEIGTHNELINKNAGYANFFCKQIQYINPDEVKI